MRYIQKVKTPNILIEWIQQNKQDINFGYDLLRQDRETIKSVSESLLREQFFLCAYTGLSIDWNKFHIEHVKPQASCTKGEDVDYKNLLACYPEPGRSVPFGAQKKGNWPSLEEEKDFISPLNSACEHKFYFEKNGKIYGRDELAEKTIKKLGLNDDKLKDLRKSSLSSLLKLKYKEANRKLNRIMIPSNGRLDEFCFVKKQVLEKQVKTQKARIQAKAKIQKQISK